MAIDEPDGLLIDVTGCDRVFGGEAKLIEKVIADLQKLGFSTRCAIAPTFGCAWALARYGEHARCIVSESEVRASLSKLPVGALRLDEATIAGLREVGIEHIGSLMDLPRSVLPARFGDHLLLRLDQALGQAIETIVPIRPIDPPRAERRFDGPTTRVEAIELTVRALLDSVTHDLLVKECGAVRLELILHRSDLAPTVLPITLSHPTRNAKHLWSLIRPRLERAHLGFGVEAIEIVICRWQRLQHEQAETWSDHSTEAAQHERECAQLIDTLANRLGRDRVTHATVIESHRPECALRFAPADLHRPRSVVSCTPHDRPTQLLDAPRTVSVVALTPDGPVHQLRVSEQEHRITHSIGPERIAPEWWRSQTTFGWRIGTRDYFKLQDDSGQWLWVFRDCGSGQWFLHGVWA